MEDPSDLNLYENTENHSSSKNKTSNTVKFCESTRFKGEEGGSKYQNIVQSSKINDKIWSEWLRKYSSYCTVSYFGLDHSTANTRHSSNKTKKYSDERLQDEDLELDNASFVLASFYVLKVLFIDMTISLGDVCTDFWQVLIDFLNSQSIHSIIQQISQISHINLNIVCS